MLALSLSQVNWKECINFTFCLLHLPVPQKFPLHKPSSGICLLHSYTVVLCVIFVCLFVFLILFYFIFFYPWVMLLLFSGQSTIWPQLFESRDVGPALRLSRDLLMEVCKKGVQSPCKMFCDVSNKCLLRS